ncbi:hypothetical protein IMZ29_00930 [Achromobacter sp. GG226]|uniref:hypothetical protein n=1 Tax=Verticiella alkaliphila TaxID=2779529 RepID=UPI001C0AC07C|nr:hypothetical protein [Verticiella sp. GG226]MBU4609167.1 hypothetical protein [Verticiella sp. GG226]
MAYYKNLPIPTRLVRDAHERHLRRIRQEERRVDAERAERIQHAQAFHPAYRARDGYVRIAEDV